MSTIGSRYKDREEFLEKHRGQAYWLSNKIYYPIVASSRYDIEDFRQDMYVELIMFWEKHKDKDFKDEVPVAALIWKWLGWRSKRYLVDYFSLVKVCPNMHAIVSAFYNKSSLTKNQRESSIKCVIKAYLARDCMRLGLYAERLLVARPDWKYEGAEDMKTRIKTFFISIGIRDRDISIWEDRVYEGRKLRELGKKYKMTFERIRQIQHKLRMRIDGNRELREFLRDMVDDFDVKKMRQESRQAEGLFGATTRGANKESKHDSGAFISWLHKHIIIREDLDEQDGDQERSD